jgi:hypothetical protein
MNRLKSMKKIVLGAIAAVLATISLSSVAAAESRGRSEEWRHDGNGRHDRGFESSRRGNDGHRHQDARRHDRWQHNGGRHYGWRGPGWRYGYWGGPRVVIAPGYADYCFIKKVRRYDAWGNLYIKRVRVCQ